MTPEDRAREQARRQEMPLPAPAARPLTPPIVPDGVDGADMVAASRFVFASVQELQDAYARGELTTRALAAELVQRIARLSADKLNAVIELNPDLFAIADACDTARAQGHTLGPLHGIPVLLKDNVGTGDAMHTTAGAVALRDAHCDRDAFIVTQLRAAGALILGKTNLSEWANYMTNGSNNGFSALGGQTRNPHGPFDVGGSSSGSGAAVAAGFAPLAVGTETAGSIISPAGQNGVVGVKPSLGLVSRDRIIPISDQMDTAGPMARCVADAALMLSVLAARDARDGLAEMVDGLHGTEFMAALREDALTGRRIGVPRAALALRVGDDMWLNHAVELLQRAGATVVQVEFTPPSIDYRPALGYGISVGVDAYLRATDAPLATLADVVAFNRADLPARAPYGQDLLEAALVTPMTADDYHAATQRNRVLAANALRELMTSYGFDMLLSLNNQLTRLYAPAGFPAVCLPLALRESGEPVGMTLVAAHGEDAALLAAAYAAEQSIAAYAPMPQVLPARLATFESEIEGRRMSRGSA